MPRRQRRGTVVKSRDPLSGFTFSPRTPGRSRRDAQAYDMSDGRLRRRSRSRTPRRRRRTRVKTPESDPLDFDEDMFSPRNTRREGMYVGSKKKDKYPTLLQQMKDNPWMKEILIKEANNQKLSKTDKFYLYALKQQPLPPGGFDKLLKKYKKKILL